MMRQAWLVTGWVLFLIQVGGCGLPTPERLGDYLSPSVSRESPDASLPSGPIHTGLVVVADTSRREAVPLPDELLDRLAETLRRELSELTSLIVDKVIPAQSIRPEGDFNRFRELGTQHGVNYLVVVVASAVEQEYPITVFLGWVTHAQPGLRRDNWTLLEMALLDLSTGQVLLRAEGFGFATLDRPTAPGISQWYPVIWSRPQDPDRRFFPPDYDRAPLTLRVVSLDEATRRLVLNFQKAWMQKRQDELEADVNMGRSS
jgi:hypothetical protein